MSNALAVRSNTTPIPSSEEFRTMLAMADTLVKSGFLPSAIDKPEKALAVWQKGRELGLEPMQSFGNIHVIKGKPTASAELMRALVERDYGGNALKITETTDKKCVVRCLHPDWTDGPVFMEFTMEEAKQAGVTANDTWKKYPAAMLRARATSAACTAHFSSSTMGLKTPEELGAAVTVGANGEVEVIPEESAEEKALASRSIPAFQTTTKDGVTVDFITGEKIEDAEIVAEAVESNGQQGVTKEELQNAINALANRLSEERGVDVSIFDAMTAAGAGAGVKTGAKVKWSDDDKRKVVDFITLELSKPLQEMAF